MDLSLDELLEKAGLGFEKIRCSSKRAELLESISRRVGVEADVVQVAMWETQWEAKAKETSVVREPPPPPPASSTPTTCHTKSQSSSASSGQASGRADPRHEQNPGSTEETSTRVDLEGTEGAVRLTVEFVDPLKGTVLSFHKNTEGRGMFYKVNDVPRSPFTRAKVSIRSTSQQGSKGSKGPRVEFPELKTAATIPWESCQTVLLGLRALAEASGVDHNFPFDGVIARRSSQLGAAPSTGGPPLGGGPPSRAARAPSTGTAAPPTSTAAPPTSTAAPKQAPAPPPPLPWSTEMATATDSGAKSENTHSSNCSSRRGGRNSTRTDTGSSGDGSQRSWRYADPNSAISGIVTTAPQSASTQGSHESQVPRSDRRDRRWFAVTEGDTLSVPPDTIARIVNAKFGFDERWFSASDPVRQRLCRGGIRPFVVSMEALSLPDPFPGMTKQLVIVYKPMLDKPQATWSGESPPPLCPPDGEIIGTNSQSSGPPPLEDSEGAGASQGLKSGRSQNSNWGNKQQVQGDKHVLLVRFKFGRSGEYLYGEPLPHGTHVAVNVVVDGVDQGMDLGLVSDHRPAGLGDLTRSRARIMRVASQQEIDWWRVKLAGMEREARKRCQEILAEQGLHTVKIAHAEFQFDQSKLTFHFVSQERNLDWQRLVSQCQRLWSCPVQFVKAA
eukprot:Hpha_TRINITY_DN16695_c1_g2::TRINITY_DN16695_c1_g2_i1::g.182516::m.182516